LNTALNILNAVATVDPHVAECGVEDVTVYRANCRAQDDEVLRTLVRTDSVPVVRGSQAGRPGGGTRAQLATGGWVCILGATGETQLSPKFSSGLAAGPGTSAVTCAGVAELLRPARAQADLTRPLQVAVVRQLYSLALPGLLPAFDLLYQPGLGADTQVRPLAPRGMLLPLRTH
jgi:hypothetical protein